MQPQTVNDFILCLTRRSVKPCLCMEAPICIIQNEFKKMHIKLRHEKADAAFVAGRVPLVAHEEVRFLFRCGQKLLSWAQKERPGDVPLPIAIAGQLKIQYSRDMMVLPKQIGIVKITVAENRVSWRERLCKKGFHCRKSQLLQYILRWTMIKRAIRLHRRFGVQAVQKSQHCAIFLQIGKRGKRLVFAQQDGKALSRQ